MKKTTKKRMSKAPKSTKQAKKDTYALGGQTRAGKAMAKRRATAGSRLKGVMSQIRKTRGK